MKLRNLFLATVACAGLFTACSNEMDENVDGSTIGTNAGEAYMQMGFSFPSADGTRATTTEAGIKEEQTFTNISLVIVKDGDVVENHLLPAADFTPEGGTGGSASGNNKLYMSKSNIKVEKQTAAVDIYAFVNPTAAIKNLAKGASFNQALIHTETTAAITIALNGNFLMSNVSGTAVKSVLTGTAIAPTSVKINVERVAAKLVENTANKAHEIVMDKDVTGYNKLTISLTDYYYTNLNKTSYILMQHEGNDVKDTNYKLTDGYTPSNSFFNFNGTGANVAGYNFQNMTQGDITYCLENTATATEQYTDKTTGVIYKATAKWGTENAKSFYSYIGKIYFTFADLNAAYTKDYGKNIDSANTENVEELAKLGVTYYKDGICYYRTMIKHEPSDVYLAPMEFAVVRNNVYYLNVAKITGLGEPTIPTNPDPDEPDPTKAELQLMVTVTPWTVRQNDFEL